MKNWGSGQKDQLNLGIYASLSTDNLRAMLTEYHRRFPDVDVHTVDGGHDKLICDLITNTIDVAILTTDNANWERLRARLVE